ncbi:C-C motif chemokine 19-like [Elgaria multicarinata webbii]|uniref:C-C motif chemokine 19-like n=1 Tax=Elgaria multicarinata webbii TaxID=159646 RepID=UPI002FCD0725
MAHCLGVLCLVSLSFWSVLQVSGDHQVMDCCLRTSPVPFPHKLVRNYREQRIQEGCPVHAVVLITVRGKQLCAPPSARWVKHLKRMLDRRHHHKKSSGTFP